MKPVVGLFLALVGLVALGASPQPRSVHPSAARPARPSSVDRTRYDRFAPNAIRRARLAFLMPKRLSNADRITAHARGDARAATSSYTVLNLNEIIKSSGATIFPLALNNAGQIVGPASIPGSDLPGFIINPSGSNGFLAQFAYDGCCYYQDVPLSISNNGGAVAGYSNFTIQTFDSTTNFDLPIIWTLTGATSSIEHVVYGSGQYGGGQDFFSIANQKIAVGGFVYGDNKMFYEAAFPISNCVISSFYAFAINDSGVIVGAYSPYGYPGRAAVLTLGGCPTYVPNVGGNSAVDAVATNGDMILVSYGAGFSLWAKGRVYPIPLPSGYDASTDDANPIGLNASDVVVGNVYNKVGHWLGAFEYVNGKSINLQSLFPPNSGWAPPMEVTGINDNGEIIGAGYLNNVLTPFALRK